LSTILDRTRRRARARLEALLLDRVLRRPIVYEDERGFRYVLYPGENARAYLENRGNYEVGETDLCERLVRRRMTTFDVGANIGLYSLLFSRLVGSAGTVHAFEAEPRNFERLRVNLALNDAINVIANDCAVFSESGSVELNMFPESFNAWHSLGRPTLPNPYAPSRTITPTRSIVVRSVSLDDYSASHQIERIDFLKIDVEGAELDVLHGCARLLAREAVDLVQFEVSLPQIASLGHSPEAIFDFLKEHGFDTRAIGIDGSLASVADPREALYANYLAVRQGISLGA